MKRIPNLHAEARELARNVLEDAESTPSPISPTNPNTSSLASPEGSESGTPVSALRSRSQNYTSESNSAKEHTVYVSVRPTLKGVASDDTLVLSEHEVLSPISLPRTIDSTLSKVDGSVGRRLRDESENQAPNHPETSQSIGDLAQAKD